ncbi:hypothetical protein N7537_005436 [Penicillium hordei]|jgi:hypothetical protein|uniref:Uncharacterized protein n=1 Tax=Penicillium hordei TaxID=40994 RepID=A0AAD6E653_9EURO|nr:uncharacterized protein N7537_005436 [Penicillium hordei]KAJ5602480.1 hypothetical protein N7537_005436 [Penicillium hordei]
MSNSSNQTPKEIELQDRERQLRRRELDLGLEKHELRIKHGKAELEKHKLALQQRKVDLERQELGIEQDKAKLKKNESKLKETIEKLKDNETGFNSDGPDIIRLAISKKFRGGMTGTKEHKLKQGEDINALQRCRYERYVYEQDLEGKEDRLPDFLDVETGLREIAQREICLREQYEQDPTKVEEKFKATEKEFKRLEYKWGMIRDCFDGPLGRAFEYWRSNPRWYMHRVLREDCAGRGGCCGRDCGCCLNRKLNETRSRAAGHCTVECGCCEKARGYELSEDDKKYFSIRYAVSEDGRKGLDLKDLRLKNLEMQSLHQQQALTEKTIKEDLMRYEFSDGAVQEFEHYINEADITDDEAEFTDDEVECTDDECPADEEDPHYHRISQASIWGLVDGNFENPFDLIDEEPTCDPKSQFDGSNLVGQEENDSMTTETDW